MYKDQDTELVIQCKQGNQSATEALVSRYEKPVYNAAYRLLGNQDDACDVTQTVFMKVFENIKQVDEKAIFFSWIYRIAINESINYLKQKTRQAPVQHDLVESDEPAQELQNIRLSEQVHSLIMGLSEDHRSVIVLRHYLECNYSEMGQILQIPEKKVKSRLFTARQQMKNKLLASGILS